MDLKQVPGGIVTIIFGIIIVALMVFLIITQYGSYQSAKTELAIEKEGLALDKARVARLEKMKREEPDIEEKLRLIEARIPDKAEQGAFIAEIGGYCQRTGLDLVSVEFREPVSKPECTELPVIVKVTGPYPGITSFVGLVQKGWRAVRVDEVKITKASEGKVQADITCSTFTREKAAVSGNKGAGQAVSQTAATAQ